MKFEKETTVSHYRILKEIGKGGMGEVFLAEDLRLDRLVAIKFLSEQFNQDAEKLSRFVQEAKAVSALNHPNILTVYEIGEHEGTQFIVTEYIVGNTLQEILNEKGLDIPKALDLSIQITSALAAAHDAGIIHRDIKSSNVMIRTDGILKLLDFGLAKLLYQGNAGASDHEAKTLARVMTLPGTLMGTPTYMSPEQIRGKELDVRTDIFSFGILLFEILTGRRPFVGESYADVMGAILKDEPLPLAHLMPNVSPELAHIVDKTLRKDREKRYQNVKDLVIDLQDLKDALKFEAKLVRSSNSTKAAALHSTGPMLPAPTMQITTEMAKPFWSRNWLLIAVVVLLTAGGFWWMSAPKEEALITAPAAFEKQDIVSWNSAPGELFSNGSFSPDGKMIAYSTAQSGSKNIWIKQTLSGEAVQVTKDAFNNQDPLWSPSGSEIAFFSNRGGSPSAKDSAPGIWRIPALGGTPALVAAVQDGSAQLRLWSKSGKVYYQSNHNLFAADIDTGETVQVTNYSANDDKIKLISISRDEERIACLQKKTANWEIQITKLSSGLREKAFSADGEIGSLVWHTDNERILYSQKVDGAFQIYTAGINDDRGSRITFGERDSVVIDVSIDGENILIASAREESNLWRADIRTLDESIVSSSIDSELWADISPDDKSIAFQSIKNPSQGSNLFKGSILIKTSGAEAPSLKIAENAFLPAWSPDGQRLAYMRHDGNENQLWMVSSTGGKEVKLAGGGIPAIGYSVLPYNRIQTGSFDWSPDSESIAYLSNRSGSPNVWQVNVAGDGGDVQITNNRDAALLLDCPLWSPDGKQIAYYVKSTRQNEAGEYQNSLWIADIGSKSTSSVLESNKIMRLIGWNSSGNALIYAMPSKVAGLPPVVELREANIETNKQTSIAVLKNAYYYNIFLSNDKKYIAYAAKHDSKDNLWIISARGGTPRKITNNNDPHLYFSSLSWSPETDAIYFGKQTRYGLISMLLNYR